MIIGIRTISEIMLYVVVDKKKKIIIMQKLWNEKQKVHCI